MPQTPADPSGPPVNADLLLRPDPAQWLEWVREAPPPEAWAARFREQLGLPAGRLIFSGHQPEFWHPGILAKWLAVAAAARAAQVTPVWLVVDQDDVGPPALRYPVRTTAGVWEAMTWDPREPPPALLPITEPASDTRAPASPAALASPAWVIAGLAAVAGAMARARMLPADPAAAASESVAQSHWTSRAFQGLLRDAPALRVGPEPILLPATRLARTGLFADLLAAMAADPRACLESYNTAAQAFPDAGIRPLRPGGLAGDELPLWSLSPDPAHPRTPVHAGQLTAQAAGPLAPRALLMTLLVRLAGAELFIHGTGGAGPEADGGYERVTDRWWSLWRPSLAKLRPDLQLAHAPLAPVALATATRRLPLAAGPIPTARDADEQNARAHRARHDPALLDQPDASAEKSRLLRAIDLAPRQSHARAALFQQLHTHLAAARASGAGRLAELDAQARRTRLARASAAVLTDRTWPVPIYPPAILAELAARVADAFGLPPPQPEPAALP